MSAILILNGDGSHSPVEESAAHEMMRAGQLDPDSFYWREGMPEWRPLKDLSPPAAGIAPPPGPPAATNIPPGYRFTRNPEPLTLIVKIMLGVSLLPATVILYQGVATLFDIIDGDFVSVQGYGHAMQVAGFVSMGVYLLTAIPFAMWIYRANVNCRGFGARLKYSPAMSIGSYFIPFANLVIPCEAMQEIWKASRNPIDWRSEKTSALVGFWWGFYLLAAVLGQIMLYIPKTKPGDDITTITTTLETIAGLTIALEFSKIILCALAFTMIHFIIRRQKELARAEPSV